MTKTMTVSEAYISSRPLLLKNDCAYFSLAVSKGFRFLPTPLAFGNVRGRLNAITSRQRDSH
jgi:hypothetical protein